MASINFALESELTQPHALLLNVLGASPAETEVTNLDLAVRINEHIGRLEIPVDYVGRVHKVDSTEQIVQDSDDMIL